jgi:hypothetical protein
MGREEEEGEEELLEEEESEEDEEGETTGELKAVPISACDARGVGCEEE